VGQVLERRGFIERDIETPVQFLQSFRESNA
jgi:hypothetical protein